MGKLSVDPETRPSSCGILWLSANTPSKKKVTLSGFLASGSLPTTRTPSLFLAAGTDTSRSGTWPTAGSRPTTLDTLDHAHTINALCFSRNRYWLCAATGPSIKIWDLESKNMVEELKPEVPGNSSKAGPPQCLSMAWSADGQTLFAGYSDNQIRVWQVSISSTR